MKENSKKNSNTEQDQSVASRWTELLAVDGFTPVVTTFLHNYAKLDPPISNTEAMLVIQLMHYKRNSTKVFPGFKTLGGNMGITHTQARKHASSLENKKYLTRIYRPSSTNEFDLSPLFKSLEAHLKKKANSKPKKSSV